MATFHIRTVHGSIRFAVIVCFCFLYLFGEFYSYLFFLPTHLLFFKPVKQVATILKTAVMAFNEQTQIQLYDYKNRRIKVIQHAYSISDLMGICSRPYYKHGYF